MIFQDLVGKKVVKLNVQSVGVLWFGNTKDEMPKPSPALDPYICQGMMDKHHKMIRADWSYGDYLADRSKLWGGSYLEKDHKFIHLGIDFNAPVSTRVFSDNDAEVVLVDDDTPEKHGWGNRVMTRLLHEDIVLIYAHLDKDVLCKVGDKLKPGDAFARLAPPERNGGWYSHAHGQAMILEAYEDFLRDPASLDGYGKQSDMEKLMRWYPNPLQWVRVK